MTFSGQRELVCEWCGEVFTAPVRQGPPPRYCRRAHRQRAYEARQAEKRSGVERPSSGLSVGQISGLADLVSSTALDEADRRRPTAARARAEQLLDAAVEALAALGVADLDDAVHLARVEAVPRLVRAVQRSGQTIADHPRKTTALLAAGDQLAGVLTAVADPERLETSSSRILAPVPVVVPPVGADGPIITTTGPVNAQGLPVGFVAAYPSGQRSLMNVAIEDTEKLTEQSTFQFLDEILPGTRHEWALRHSNRDHGARTAWEPLGIALATIATGYHHPDTEPPPSIANGGRYVGRTLAVDLAHSTHWRIPLDDIRDRLTDAGYIHIHS